MGYCGAGSRRCCWGGGSTGCGSCCSVGTTRGADAVVVADVVAFAGGAVMAQVLSKLLEAQSLHDM